MSPRPDPFARAECTQPGRDPRWWESDAPVEDQAVAAALCSGCRAAFACHAYAEALGPAADGIYAGELHRIDYTAADQDLAPFLAMLGIDIGDNEAAAPMHPAQLALNIDLPNRQTANDDAGTLFA